jgi:hypothetical protein
VGVSLVALIVLLAALAVAALTRRHPDDSGHGSRPGSTGSTGSTVGSTPATAAPIVTLAPQTVDTGVRVPPTGYIRLTLDQVQLYRFFAGQGRQFLIDGTTDGCADLIPWTLHGPGGGAVAEGSFQCDEYGPFTLTVGGTYTLQIGAGGDGNFSFKIILR